LPRTLITLCLFRVCSEQTERSGIASELATELAMLGQWIVTLNWSSWQANTHSTKHFVLPVTTVIHNLTWNLFAPKRFFLCNFLLTQRQMTGISPFDCWHLRLHFALSHDQNRQSDIQDILRVNRIVSIREVWWDSSINQRCLFFHLYVMDIYRS
jgi:hypothetical protein